MRLLLISVKSKRSRGGIATWTDRFLANCERQEINCTLVNTEMIGKRKEQGTARRNMFDEFARTKRIFRDLNQSLKSDGFDAAHLNTSCGRFGLFRDYLIAKKIKKHGIKLITHFHCDIPYWINNSFSNRCLGKLARLSDTLLVLCENSRKYLEDSFSVQSYKIPNFIDESMILADDKKISKTVSTAIFVGRVEKAKGAHELFELAKRFPDIQFKMVGTVSDTVASWDKPENVELVGALPHDTVIAEMDKADVFIFPSHSEGFSIALTEAMARGLPSIATDVGAAADMLDGGCGIITAVKDISGIEFALHNLADVEIRRLMSINAKKKVQQEYSAGIIIQSLNDYYSNK